jgi:hypothetical protein
MFHLTQLLHIGDISLTLAAAAGVSAWLLAARAWRMAFWWSLLFLLGIGVVGASKIAFLAWGTGLPGLEFRAVSGHATGVTAVATTLGYLLLRRRGAGMAAGLAIGATMAVLLVVTYQHSVSEAMAGWALGAAISLGGIALAGERPPRRPSYALACSALVFLLAASFTRTVPFGYLMHKTAKHLSSHAAPCQGKPDMGRHIALRGAHHA